MVPTAVGGLDRAAAILGAFDASPPRAHPGRPGRARGLPRSTTHRTADRMIRLGWLDKPEDRYRIGNRLFEISSLAPIRHELREAVLPFLQDLHRGDQDHRAARRARRAPQVLVVEKITGHRPMPMLAQVGGTIPAHCSALGRAILAYSRAGRRSTRSSGPACCRGPRARSTSPVAVLRELAAIPSAAGRSTARRATSASAASRRPSSARSGEVAAALSVTGPTGLVRADRIGPAVRLAAAAASRAYASPPPLSSAPARTASH